MTRETIKHRRDLDECAKCGHTRNVHLRMNLGGELCCHVDFGSARPEYDCTCARFVEKEVRLD